MTKLKRLATALIVLSACAPVSRLPEIDTKLAEVEARKQRELVVEQILADQRRLHQVTYPILRHNWELCGEKMRHGIGLVLVNKHQFPEEFQGAAQRAANLDDVLQVLAVAPNSPAEDAGLKGGDRLVRVNGEDVKKGVGALKHFAEFLRTETRSKSGKAEFLWIEYLRHNAMQNTRIIPVRQCDIAYHVSQRPIINAFADGKDVWITAGMMRFARRDSDLATVVGHEIAHNTMKHVNKQQGNQAVGLIFDLLAAGFGVNTGGIFSDIAGQAFSQPFEAEADYVGLYLTARAGYDIEIAPKFWRRMGIAHPGSIRTNHAASHPGTPERFVALEKTVREILNKMAAGKELVPEVQ